MADVVVAVVVVVAGVSDNDGGTNDTRILTQQTSVGGDILWHHSIQASGTANLLH